MRSEKFSEYCNTVLEQIRWKKARPIIEKEIGDHLQDQKDAYILNGDDECAAEQKAVLQMGDAVTTGQLLDKAHRPRPQPIMLIFTAILMLLGLCINYIAYTSNVSSHSFSVMSYIIAYGIFLLCYFVDFSFLARHAGKIYAVLLLLSLLVFFLKNGYSRDVYLTVFTISAAYISLIAPLAFALFIYKMRGRGLLGVLFCGAAYLPFAVILLLIPTVGGIMLFTLASLVLLCTAIIRGWFDVSKRLGLLIVLIPTAIIISIAFIAALPNRLNVYLNPSESSSGYLYSLLREIVLSAALFGMGEGATDILLTTARTDYIFTFIIRSLGLFAAVLVGLFIAVFGAAAIYKALKEKSVLGTLLSLSAALTFTFQAVFYIIDNLGYGLLSPLSLPFISYGSTALLTNAALMGLMLSVFRTGEIYRLENKKALIKTRLISYENGKLILNLKSNDV